LSSPTRPPRHPSPFPYTTLFRSASEVPPGHEQLGVQDRGPRSAANRIVAQHDEAVPEHPVRGDPPYGDAHSPPGVTIGRIASDRDRKSTRLNSSHLVTSYAVFCL